MKSFLPYSLLIILFCTSSLTPKTETESSPLASYSTLWNSTKYLKCNTASKAGYMTATEKEVIYVLNLARLDPVLFANTVVKKYPSSHSTYYESLLANMLALKPINLLSPDSLCFVGANCHAINSGLEGYVGHERSSDECRKKWYFNGECCDYGHNKAIDIVMSLLLDEGIESLGHRKICLGRYNKIGVSIQPHTVYRYTTVIDFHE